MKIDPTLKSGLTGEVRTDTRPAKAAADPAAGPTASADVQLSPLASQLQALKQEIDASPDLFDAQQVEAIKQAMAEGRFSINPERIADRLIETAQELLAPPKK